MSGMIGKGLAAWAVIGLGVPAVAQAQVDPYYYNGAANTFLNSEINRTMILPVTPGANTPQARRPAASSAAPLMDRVQAAALAPLVPEFNRRVAADGQDSAQAWLNASAREIGRQAGGLMPEYQRRVASQGQAAADAWYVAAAGDLSRRYVQSGR